MHNNAGYCCDGSGFEGDCTRIHLSAVFLCGHPYCDGVVEVGIGQEAVGLSSVPKKGWEMPFEMLFEMLFA